ncbi:MAG: N-acetylmuramoyl-L-alanine amidase [Candidatus Hydrogenedentes bacterium]|nr:N-acetylmuramoyl-L-alanine amidase [Candidatus Hydrogenedentota bacterium]
MATLRFCKIHRTTGLYLWVGAIPFLALRADADVFRVPFDSHAHLLVHAGRGLFLECQPPGGGAGETVLKGYLLREEDSRVYAGKGRVAIPMRAIKPDVQRRMLLTAFPNDVVDERGWTHQVRFGDRAGESESLEALCEWLTGSATNAKWVIAENQLKTARLVPGQTVLIPARLLRDVMKTPTPKAVEAEPVQLEIAAEALTYGTDPNGPHALYRLKPGEALYTAVVVRFTDFEDNAAILEACETIRKRSGIPDVHHMPAGQKVLIPLEMLSDRFRPAGSPERADYEQRIQEAKQLKGQVKTRDLDGVVVVIDPGHGGRDYGARNAKYGLYEDELNYELACRVKKLIETQTRAKVYMTLCDRSQGFEPASIRTFKHDTDEEVCTTPPYRNSDRNPTDAKVSANLRWLLANAYYRRELAAGTDPKKMIFTSFHCDALFNEQLRGAMVYLPGAKHRRDRETHSGRGYDQFKEVREQPYATSTAAERRRDEALSRNFAVTFLEALGRRRIKRHSVGDPIRSQIRQDGGRVYVPSVLRNTMIPTKVLIESANLTNPDDCERVADPTWRQAFAEAYVDALKMYFGS